VELAGGLAGKFNLALAVANLPSEIGTEGSHGGQDNAPNYCCCLWLLMYDRIESGIGE
jgi:hypothetical protein